MNAIVPTQPAEAATVTTLVPAGMFSNPERFDFAQRVAQVFAKSDIVPKHMQTLPNCLIAMHMAERLNEDPLTTMQNIMIVSGRPGFMTSYMIARANRSGVFRGRITWARAGEGDKMVVTASAVLADTGEVVTAETSMAMAKAEGWTKNAKYQSMPEHMLRYRSAAMLIRLYCPEVMLGMQTVEELETPASEAVELPRRGRAPRPPGDVATIIEAAPEDATKTHTSGATADADDAPAHPPTDAPPPGMKDAALTEGRGGPPRPPMTPDVVPQDASAEREYGTEESMRAAYDEGVTWRESGKARRGLPPEYRVDGAEREASAWYSGFDGNAF